MTTRPRAIVRAAGYCVAGAAMLAMLLAGTSCQVRHTVAPAPLIPSILLINMAPDDYAGRAFFVTGRVKYLYSPWVFVLSDSEGRKLLVLLDRHVAPDPNLRLDDVVQVRGVVTYFVPGVESNSGLKFAGQRLADEFYDKWWNRPVLAAQMAQLMTSRGL